MTDWREPSKHALFVSEIATISLLGRKEDIEYLESLLEEDDIEHIRRELIVLADKIRSRHSMGLRKDCCERCPRFRDCDLKWLKAERSMRPTCCPQCPNFKDCLREFKKSKPRSRRKDDPPSY